MKSEILGIHEIAKGLGCSTRTVRRLHKKGAIPTFQAGDNTSPIKMSRVDLLKIKKRKR